MSADCQESPSNYLTLTSGFAINGSAMSACAWLYHGNTTREGYAFGLTNTAEDDYVVLFYASNDDVRLGTDANEYPNGLETGVVPGQQSWTFVGFTIDSGTAKVYAALSSGTSLSIASETLSGHNITSPSQLLVFSSAWQFDGAVWNLRFFNRVLSENELWRERNAAHPCAPDLYAWYPFNDDVDDYGPNGLDLTWTGTSNYTANPPYAFAGKTAPLVVGETHYGESQMVLVP